MERAYYLYRPLPQFEAFQPGMVLSLITETRDFLKYRLNPALVRRYFPAGLSPHGLSSLAAVSCSHAVEPVIELVFELVRQQRYPGMPSRLQSMYASKTEMEALRWQKVFQTDSNGKPDQIAASLWEIEYDTKAESFDASLLELGPRGKFDYLDCLNNAHRYWRKDHTSTPLYELLVPYPVTLVKVLREFDGVS